MLRRLKTWVPISAAVFFLICVPWYTRVRRPELTETQLLMELWPLYLFGVLAVGAAFYEMGRP